MTTIQEREQKIEQEPENETGHPVQRETVSLNEPTHNTDQGLNAIDDIRDIYIGTKSFFVFIKGLSLVLSNL